MPKHTPSSSPAESLAVREMGTLFTRAATRSSKRSFGYWDPRSVRFKNATYSSGLSRSRRML